MEIRRDKMYNRRGFSNEEYRLIKDGKIKIELVKGSLVDEQRLLK